MQIKKAVEILERYINTGEMGDPDGFRHAVLMGMVSLQGAAEVEESSKLTGKQPHGIKG